MRFNNEIRQKRHNKTGAHCKHQRGLNRVNYREVNFPSGKKLMEIQAKEDKLSAERARSQRYIDTNGLFN